MCFQTFVKMREGLAISEQESGLGRMRIGLGAEQLREGRVEFRRGIELTTPSCGNRVFSPTTG